MTTTPTIPNRIPMTSGRRPSSVGRTVLIVLGVIVALDGVGASAGGGVMLWADHQREQRRLLQRRTRAVQYRLVRDIRPIRARRRHRTRRLLRRGRAR